jgi:hypothetical protein
VRSVWLSYEEMGGEKFISHGFGDYRPHTPTSATMNNFRALRARQHGTAPRQAPRTSGNRRGLLRYSR